MPRSRGTEVHGLTVVSDGHTHADLAYINIKEMQEYLASTEEDFYALLNATISKAYSEYNEREEEKEKALEAKKNVTLSEKIKEMQKLNSEIEETINPAPKKRGKK